MATRAEDRPVVLLAEQAIGDRLHVQEVLGLRADPAENAEDRLDEQRRLDDPALQEVGQVVQVAHVVALEFEARPLGAERADDHLDVRVRVPEDEVAGHLEVLRLPGVLEVLDPPEHREQAEVHAAHVQRAELGLERAGRPRSLLDGHAVPTAGRDVDDGVAARLDRGQEPGEQLGIGRRSSGLRVACVQVEDCRPRLGRPDRALGDLLGCDRQVRALRRDMDRPGHGAADDHLASASHCVRDSRS